MHVDDTLDNFFYIKNLHSTESKESLGQSLQNSPALR